MNIDPLDITVRELTEDYEDNDELGVRAYSGNLDVRPPYQREFVYKEKQRDAVIETLAQGYPLNVMYWAVRDEDETYEVIDGQQRTISICQFVDGDFAYKGRYFHNLQKDEREQILDYTLKVYLCSGTDSEKLQWFKTINIAGAELTNQELRNAVYHGSWVADAKRYFSKSGCPAYGIASDLLSGSPIRQEFLETAIKWINSGDIEPYMATHQHDPNAQQLWLYFQAVVAWVRSTFPTWRKPMKGVPWGALYNEFRDEPLDAATLEVTVKSLMIDDEVQRKSGIYSYVLTKQEKHLSLRQFTEAQRRQAYESQDGVCPMCSRRFTYEEMEADHIDPWHSGGKTIASNCQMLCLEDNRRKGGV